MELPLKRIALFSSGVGYFEHSGEAGKPENFSLSFKNNAVDDILKSLTINDPASDFPAVSYSSPESIEEAMQSLKVGFSAERRGGLLDILDSLRGAEIEVSCPAPVLGRVLSVEYEFIPLKFDGYEAETKAGKLRDALLLLLTAEGMRSIHVGTITNYVCKDEKISADLNRALDLLLSSRDKENVNLSISLPGEGRREVSLSYVIAAPVWKAAYRLDLGGEKPLLQGWAIVDNDGNSDWNDVELSLVTGRPVSFIQNLYRPYHTDRPVLPLAIANFAKARAYESGTPFLDKPFISFSRRRHTTQEDINQSFQTGDNENDEEGSDDYLQTAANENISKVETAGAQDAGDQFEFTFRRPVNLARRSSAMFPLVASPLEAEKFLVLTDETVYGHKCPHPARSVKLTNTTGMKLPAGPVTVYDGVYAGDALVGFFPENEQRFISFGEDLTVTSGIDSADETIFAAASIAEGRVTIKRRGIHKKIYTVRNAAATAKKLVVQHRITDYRAVLVEPVEYMEKTPEFYRFKMDLPAAAEISFTVKEEEPLTEILALADMNDDAILAYIADGELSADVKESFNKALALKKNADGEQKRLEELAAQKEKLIVDQDRIRKNLESAGSSSPHGQKYLKRMDAIDEQIDALDGEIAAAEKLAREAAGAYGKFIGDESWKPESGKDDDTGGSGDTDDDSNSSGKRRYPKGFGEI
jgi:hypothetical protein